MANKIGSMNGAFVWLFALGAILLGAGSGYLTANMSAAVSSTVYFVIFAVAGYLAALLTSAKTGVGVGAFLLAALVTAGAYYWVTTAAVADATAELGDTGALGAVVGIFVAVVTFLVTTVAGVGGVLAGARARKRAAALPA